MISVTIQDAKTRLSSLIERATAGEEVVISKAGLRVAQIIPIKEKKRKRQSGTDRGRVWIAPDFDQTDEETIRAFEGDSL